MMKRVSSAAALLLFMTVLTGLVYPLAITAVAQVFFPGKANGSLVDRRGAVVARPARGRSAIVGSALIGQQFTLPEYFHPRPSAAGTGGYDAAASAGSNLGPTSRRLFGEVAARVASVRQENGMSRDASVPADLVTASASGLDPHISPDAARLQVARVARARGLAEAQVVALIDNRVEAREFGILGEARVNVLLLNIALDRMSR